MVKLSMPDDEKEIWYLVKISVKTDPFRMYSETDYNLLKKEDLIICYGNEKSIRELLHLITQ